MKTIEEFLTSISTYSPTTDKRYLCECIPFYGEMAALQSVIFRVVNMRTIDAVGAFANSQMTIGGGEWLKPDTKTFPKDEQIHFLKVVGSIHQGWDHEKWAGPTKSYQIDRIEMYYIPGEKPEESKYPTIGELVRYDVPCRIVRKKYLNIFDRRSGGHMFIPFSPMVFSDQEILSMKPVWIREEYVVSELDTSRVIYYVEI